MITRSLLFLLLTLLPISIVGQTRKVSATYRYYADSGQSPKEAKAIAVEKARIEAIANEFGTLITQDVLSQTSDTKEFFMQLSTAELKGEWVKDLTAPEVKLVDTTSDDIYVYEAKVKGLARPVRNENAEFETVALRNGTDKKYASTNFKEGDRLYLYFKAPTDGYVAAFCIDEQQRVLCILPHENSPKGQMQVKGDKEYCFFSKSDTHYNYEDGLAVTCGDEHLEMNRIYVIFSPNPFVKPVVNAATPLNKKGLVLPRQLSLQEFSNWMHKAYASDKKMSRKVLRIRIKK